MGHREKRTSTVFQRHMRTDPNQNDLTDRNIRNEDSDFRKEDKLLGGILWALLKQKYLKLSLYWMHRCTSSEK